MAIQATPKETKLKVDCVKGTQIYGKIKDDATDVDIYNTALAIGELKATAIENVVLVKESVLADKPEA